MGLPSRGRRSRGRGICMVGNLDDAPRGTGVSRWLRHPLLAVVAVLAVLMFNQAAAFAVTGNIGSSTIEIDSPVASNGDAVTPGANLFPGSTTCTSGTFPTSGALDWVKDCNTNTDSGTLSGGVATGLLAGQTAASPICNGTSVTTNCAKGHWNGARIVDGIAGNDQD